MPWKRYRWTGACQRTGPRLPALPKSCETSKRDEVNRNHRFPIQMLDGAATIMAELLAAKAASPTRVSAAHRVRPLAMIHPYLACQDRKATINWIPKQHTAPTIDKFEAIEEGFGMRIAMNFAPSFPASSSLKTIAGVLRWPQSLAARSSMQRAKLEFGIGGRSDRLPRFANVQTKQEVPPAPKPILQAALSRSSWLRLVLGGWTQNQSHLLANSVLRPTQCRGH